MLVVLPGGVALLWASEGWPISELGLRFSSRAFLSVIFGLLIGFIVPALGLFLELRVGWILLERPSWLEVSLSTFLGVASYQLFIVFAEELTYRGFFLQRLQRTLGSQHALLLSSLLFALMHLPALLHSMVPHYLFPIALLTFLTVGVTLGIGFQRTGSLLWLPLGIHFAYNMVYENRLFVISRISTRNGWYEQLAPAWVVGDGHWLPESGLMGFVQALGILALIIWVTRWRASFVGGGMNSRG